MIPGREILDLRTEWSLDAGVVEKDYVLGWLLAGIANEPELARSWVFKGGTCLRKCYYETYRFSEDLDFTVINGSPATPDELTMIFRRVSAWLQEEAGIELVVDDTSFRSRQNRRGNPTGQGRLAYRGPNRPPQLPKVKLDITSDEILVQEPETRVVGHQYSDGPLPGVGVLCYTLNDLFGEKLRALAERCRPRDLYDVVHMHRHPDLIGRSRTVAAVLTAKCAHAGIEVPTADTIRSSPHREEIKNEWENMLGHQLPRPLPAFADFWVTLDDVFAWLGGAVTPRRRHGPIGVTSTRPGSPPGQSRRGGAASRSSLFATRVPPEGGYRLQGRGRPMGTPPGRAVLAAPDQGRQLDSLRDQRPWPTPGVSR